MTDVVYAVEAESEDSLKAEPNHEALHAIAVFPNG
jgi:hypothetical protein